VVFWSKIRHAQFGLRLGCAINAALLLSRNFPNPRPRYNCVQVGYRGECWDPDSPEPCQSGARIFPDLFGGVECRCPLHLGFGSVNGTCKKLQDEGTRQEDFDLNQIATFQNCGGPQSQTGRCLTVSSLPRLTLQLVKEELCKIFSPEEQQQLDFCPEPEPDLSYLYYYDDDQIEAST